MRSFGILKTNQKIHSLLQDKLYINAFYLLVLNLFPSVTGMIFWAISGRVYSSGAIGVAAAVYSAVALIALLADFGLTTSMMRFLPEAKDKANFINSTYSLIFWLSLILSICYLLGSSIWARNLITSGNIYIFCIVFILFAIVTALGGTVRDTFIAYREAKYAFLYTVIVNVLRLGLIIPGITFGALGLYSSTAVAYTAGLILAFIILSKKMNHKAALFINLDYRKFASLVPYSLGAHISNLLNLIPQLLFPLLVLERLGPILNAHAYIALMIGSVITIPSMAIMNSALVESANQLDRADQIFLRVSVIGIILSIVLGFIVFWGAGLILSIWGNEYVRDSSMVLRLFALSAPLVSATQSLVLYLKIFKRIKPMITINLLIAVVMIAVVWTFIPYLGINALGYSVLAANSIVAALYLGLLITRRPKISLFIADSLSDIKK